MKSVGSWRKWLALGLVLLSGVWFVCLLIVPFSELALSMKAVLGTAFFSLMEGAFYLGVFLAGKQLFSRYWKSVRPRVRRWFSDGQRTS